MSEPTIYEAVQSRVAAVGGQCWIDELLIRGSPDGIKGAHVKIGWSAPGVMGATESGTTNANAVTMETGEPLWEALKTDLNATALQQVLDLTDERDALLEDKASLEGTVSSQQQTIDQLTQQISELQQQLANIEWVDDPEE